MRRIGTNHQSTRNVPLPRAPDPTSSQRLRLGRGGGRRRAVGWHRHASRYRIDSRPGGVEAGRVDMPESCRIGHRRDHGRDRGVDDGEARIRNCISRERRDHDGGHVVLTAGGVRGVGERVGGPLRVGLLAKDARDVGWADHGGETVGADQEPVTGLQLDRVEVDADVGVDPERAGDDRSLRVDQRLVRGDAALADHLLDEAVVLGDLARARRRAAR